jgi:hypothetical protein
MGQYFLPLMLTPPVFLSKIHHNHDPQALWTFYSYTINVHNLLKK